MNAEASVFHEKQSPLTISPKLDLDPLFRAVRITVSEILKDLMMKNSLWIFA